MVGNREYVGEDEYPGGNDSAETALQKALLGGEVEKSKKTTA